MPNLYEGARDEDEVRILAAIHALGAMVAKQTPALRQAYLQKAGGDRTKAAKAMYDDAAQSAVGYADALIQRLKAPRDEQGEMNPLIETDWTLIGFLRGQVRSALAALQETK